jgi:hypothetical protein
MDTILLFRLLLIGVACSQTDFVCTLSAALEASVLPNITNQFTTRVEVNVENEGYTVNLVEYYDEPNDRSRLDLLRSGMQPISRIYNFADKQWFLISGSTCTAHRFSPEQQFPKSPVAFDDQGNAHIQGVNSFLKFGSQYNETYVGRKSVRGISADHWRSCLHTRFGGNMSLDWYFAAANWTTANKGTPLRLVVEGVFPDPLSNTSNKSMGFRPFKNSYEFVFFTPGQPDNELFQIPQGLFCDGDQVAKNLPPVPSQFSARIQAIDAIKKTAREFKEVYNAKNQRFWFHNSSSVFVQDFRIGVGYKVFHGNCSAFPLTLDLIKQHPSRLNMGELTLDNKRLQLVSVRTLFGLSSQFNVSYVGIRTVNDIPCDVFIEERRVDSGKPGNITVTEISFARKSFTFFNNSNAPEHQFPVRLEVYSKNLVGTLSNPPSQEALHQIFNIYDFQWNPQNVPGQGTDVFTKQCYDSYRNVWFQLDGKVDQRLLSKINSLKSPCIDAVATAARIDRSRVTDVRLTQISNRVLLVRTVLLGFLSNANITTSVAVGVALDDAISHLQQAVDNGQLQIIGKFGKKQTQFKGRKGSVITDLLSSTTQLPTQSSSSSEYTAGQMVGLAVAMLIVGMAIGAVVLFAFMKKRHAATVEPPYNKQNDTM